LEVIGILSKTYFGFGYPNGYPVGDRLRAATRRHALKCQGVEHGGGKKVAWGQKLLDDVLCACV
jgi:hypothetical protein